MRERLGGQLGAVGGVPGLNAPGLLDGCRPYTAEPATAFCAYDPAKGGIDALTRNVAVEYRPVGIRANAIAPGAALTEGMRGSIDQWPDPEGVVTFASVVY